MLRVLPTLLDEPAARAFLQALCPPSRPQSHALLEQTLRQPGPWCVFGSPWQWLARLERLDFDSQLFGYGMARLEPLLHYPAWPNAAQLATGCAFFQAVRDQGRKQGHEFLMARINSRDMLAAQSLEEAGFRLVDVSVEWEVGLDSVPCVKPAGHSHSVAPWEETDRSALIALAGSAFSDLEAYADRFTQDPRLRPCSGKLYETWLANCLAGSQADQVLVLKKQQQAVGFIALRLPQQAGQAAWVVLNALQPALRGQGLYNYLLLAGLHWLKGRGISQARVRTKLSQQAVIQAWSKLGGRQVSADMTFHCWETQRA